jgi:hypothetical protein
VLPAAVGSLPHDGGAVNGFYLELAPRARRRQPDKAKIEVNTRKKC